MSPSTHDTAESTTTPDYAARREQHRKAWRARQDILANGDPTIPARDDHGHWYIRLTKPGASTGGAWRTMNGDYIPKATTHAVLADVDLLRTLSRDATATVTIHPGDLAAARDDERDARRHATMRRADSRLLTKAWDLLDTGDPTDPTIAALRRAAGIEGGDQ